MRLKEENNRLLIRKQSVSENMNKEIDFKQEIEVN